MPLPAENVDLTLIDGGHSYDEPQERALVSNAQLTRRELEIAALVAQGLSNLQIAQRLVITEGTTQNHLSHILDKLGLTSRTQVVVWLLSAQHPGASQNPRSVTRSSPT